MASQIIHNIKLFIIGSLLLSGTFWYIQGHPGEQSSFFPTIEMIAFKAKVTFYNLIGKDTYILQKQQDFLRMYKELEYLLASSNCAETDAMKSQIAQQQELIKQMEWNERGSIEYSAITIAQEVREQIAHVCATPTP